MKKFSAIVVLVLLSVSAAYAYDYRAIPSSGCAVFKLQTTTTDVYFTGGRAAYVTLDLNGDTAVVRAWGCNKVDCQNLGIVSTAIFWDPTGSGSATQQDLNGDSNTLTRGHMFHAEPVLRFEVITPPSANDVVTLSACGK